MKWIAVFVLLLFGVLTVASATRDANFLAHAASRANGRAGVMACQMGACADDQQRLVRVPIPDAVRACLPERIHPVSRQYLDAYLVGHISRAEFLRSFSLPNSDYLAVQDCIVAAVDTAGRDHLTAPAVAHRFEMGGNERVHAAGTD